MNPVLAPSRSVQVETERVVSSSLFFFSVRVRVGVTLLVLVKLNEEEEEHWNEKEGVLSQRRPYLALTPACLLIPNPTGLSSPVSISVCRKFVVEDC